MAADHPHPLRLDGQCRLGRLLLWDDHHRAQVDYASAVGWAKRKDKLVIATYARRDFRRFWWYKPIKKGLWKLILYKQWDIRGQNRLNLTACHLPVWSRTSYPPGRVFTDKQAVTRTPHIFLSCWGVLDGLEGNISKSAQFNTELNHERHKGGEQLI